MREVTRPERLTKHPAYGWAMAPCDRCGKDSVMAALFGLCLRCTRTDDEDYA